MVHHHRGGDAAADDSGHRATCEYLGNWRPSRSATGAAPGRPLERDTVAAFRAPRLPLLDANRAWWKIVYQTTHFALRRLETSKAGDETRGQSQVCSGLALRALVGTARWEPLQFTAGGQLARGAEHRSADRVLAI
jgi:hypothetical protein